MTAERFTSRSRGDGSSFSGLQMDPVRVLIVDKHPLVREGFRSMLATANDIEVAGEASDGLEAVVWAAEHNVDVVLLDLHMPKLNGLEAARRIKAQRPGTIIVMLTQRSDDASVVDAVQAGASAYLLKDVSCDLLIHDPRGL